MDIRQKEIELGDKLENLFRCYIYPDRNLVILKLKKTVVLEDIARWENAMMREPLFSTDMDGVVDQREASANLDLEDVKKLADMNKTQHKVPGKWIHLVNDPMATAMAVLYRNEVAECQPIETYSTIEAASKSLGYELSPYIHAAKE